MSEPNSSKPPSALRADQPPAAKDIDDPVALIPGWAQRRRALLSAAAAAVFVAILYLGHRHGPTVAWTLMLVICLSAVTAWGTDYACRKNIHRWRSDNLRYQQHRASHLEALSWRQFELYCAELLDELGYRDIRHTGSTSADHGADITAINSQSIPVAVQCKHHKTSIGLGVIRELIGTVTTGIHHGRTGVLITSSEVTPNAKSLARDSQIQVIDIRELLELMGTVREQIENRASNRPSHYPLLRWGSQALTAGMCTVTVLTALHSYSDAPHPPPTAVELPKHTHSDSNAVRVVEKLIAAINQRDWPTVWNLWHHAAPGRGLAYQDMVAGYRLTARDVITKLSTSADSVRARIEAHETTGDIRTYNFTYMIRAGQIIWGRSELISTRHATTRDPRLRQPQGFTAEMALDPTSQAAASAHRRIGAPEPGDLRTTVRTIGTNWLDLLTEDSG